MWWNMKDDELWEPGITKYQEDEIWQVNKYKNTKVHNYTDTQKIS